MPISSKERLTYNILTHKGALKATERIGNIKDIFSSLL